MPPTKNVYTSATITGMYYAKPIADVFMSLATQKEGLESSQLEKRRESFGFNELPKKSTPWWVHLVRQFQDIMVYILLAAFALSLVTPFFEEGPLHLESFLDAIVILAILVMKENT